MLERDFQLDMMPNGVPLQFDVSQYDSDEMLHFHLYSSQGDFSVSQIGVTANVRGTKLDGFGIQNNCVLSWDSNGQCIASFQLTKQMTAIAGRTPFEIVLTNLVGTTSYDLPSSTFFMNIKRAALDYDTLTSDSDINEIAQVMSKADQLIAAAAAIEQAAEDLGEVVIIINNLASLQQTVSDLSSEMVALQTTVSRKVDDGYVDNGVAYFTGDGEVLFSITGIGGGGGGGGGGSDSTLTVTNTTSWAPSTTVSMSDDLSLQVQITWSSTEDGLPTGNGTIQITVNGVVKYRATHAQGVVNLEIGSYIAIGDNTIVVRVLDSTGNWKDRTMTVTGVSLTISSTLNRSEYITNGVLGFRYTPTGGAISKTVRFIVDGNTINPITVTTTASNRELSQNIPSTGALSHGSHTLEVYMTATIGGSLVESNHLYYDLMFVTTGNTTPILTVNYFGTHANQYSTVSIPYMAYQETNPYLDVEISVDGVNQGTFTVGRTEEYFNYLMKTVGQHTFVFSTTVDGNTVSKTIIIICDEVDIDISPVEENLLLYLSSIGRSNAEQDPAVWTSGSVACTFSNFNWSSDGWITDSEGNVALRLQNDARLTIPFQPFASDFRTTGYTLEFDFETSGVKDYDQPIISCLNNGRGVVITSQSCTFSSEQTTISYQYKEEEHVRVSFVIQKNSSQRLVFVYVNGIASGVIRYATDDDFTQQIPQDITIGSSYATVDIYTIRMYNNDLRWNQIVQNWIADTANGELLVDRYRNNDVYDDNGEITINKLPSKLPYMILIAAELPQYKGDKENTLLLQKDVKQMFRVPHRNIMPVKITS